MYDLDGNEKTDMYSEILITKRHTREYLKQNGLKKILTPSYIWGIGVGTVITGQFLGWNYGLGQAGPLGFMLVTAVVSLFYFSYVTMLSKLAVAYPYAGGAYGYTRKGMGKLWGFLAGFSTMTEFICVAAVIFIYMNLYINSLISSVLPNHISFLIFAALILIQLGGIKQSSLFQLIMTTICVSAFLMFFMGTNSVGHSLEAFDFKLPMGIEGLFLAVPFAIWFFICIEVTALTAEETKNPQKHIPSGFISSLSTIILLSFGIVWFSVRSVDWTQLITANYPLIFILEKLQEGDKVLLTVFAFFSLSSFVACLNGIITGYSRQVFSLSRAGYLPELMGKVFSRSKVPYMGVAVPSIAVILLFKFGNAALMTRIACLCAFISYIFVFISYIKITRLDKKLGKSEPNNIFYVYLGLLMAIAFLCILVLLDKRASLFTAGIYGIAALYYFVMVKSRINNDAPEEVEANTDEINIIITNL